MQAEDKPWLKEFEEEPMLHGEAHLYNHLVNGWVNVAPDTCNTDQREVLRIYVDRAAIAGPLRTGTINDHNPP